MSSYDWANSASFKRLLADPEKSLVEIGIFSYLCIPENRHLVDVGITKLKKHFKDVSPKGGCAGMAKGLDNLVARGYLPELKKQTKPTCAQYGKPGFIYFVQSELSGLTKIGSSANPKQRARNIQANSCGKVLIFAAIKTEDMGRDEDAFHDWFSDFRKDGEWFDLSFFKDEDLLEIIAGSEVAQ